MQEDDKAEAMKSRKGWPEARSYRRYLNQKLEVQKGKGKKTHFRAEKPIKKQNKQKSSNPR